MFWRRPKLTPQEHARALELVLRDLAPADRRRAEALLDRMTSKDRREAEHVLIKSGAKYWPRIEKLMLRFGDLAPAPSEQADEGAPSAPRHRTAPADDQASAQREQANRALGR